LILALKKHAVRNAITSINLFNAIENYINWRYKFRIAFYGAFL